MIRVWIVLFGFFIVPCWLASNPFKIDFPDKKDLTHEDYIALQKALRQIELLPLLKSLYPENGDYTTLEDFQRRCTKGIKQILIDPDKGLYPIKKLEKLGRGGENCVVCAAPFNRIYPEYVRSLAQGLREQKFDGYFLYYIGGWPNPTGKEAKYAAVPYSFKIFAMVEAHLLGFKNVLWIDSAAYPIRDITPLFDKIDSEGALLSHFPMPDNQWRYLLPGTRDELEALTHVDLLNPKTEYIPTVMFGLNMETKEAKHLVEQYYRIVDLGTPFLSCFPEEWVLSAIIAQPEFKHWKTPRILNIIGMAPPNVEDSPEEMENAKKRGHYFYHRKGR